MKKTVKHGKMCLMALVLLAAVMLLPGRAQAAQEDKVWVVFAFDADGEAVNMAGAYVVSGSSGYSVYTDIYIYDDSYQYQLVNLTDGSVYSLEVNSGISDLGLLFLSFSDSTPSGSSGVVTCDAPEENEAAYFIIITYGEDGFDVFSSETSIISATADENGYMYLGLSSVDTSGAESMYYPGALVNSEGELLGMLTSADVCISLVTGFDEFGTGSSNSSGESTTTEAATTGEDTTTASSGRETRESDDDSTDTGNDEEETTTVAGTGGDSDSTFRYWWVIAVGGVVVIILVIAVITLSKKKGSANSAGQTGNGNGTAGGSMGYSGPSGYNGTGGYSGGTEYAGGGAAPDNGHTVPLNNYGGNMDPYATPVQPVNPSNPANVSGTEPVPPQPAPGPAATSLVGIKGVMEGRIYPITPEGINIGRDPSNVIVYPADTNGVSRLHCRLFYSSAGELMLMDCGSKYGTVLVGTGKLAPQQAVKVKAGDRFYVGSEKNGFELR